ncbi:cell wall hydrolase [Sphingomonas sp.]|uniref:cell wall hydrolase n=1 Tax=Sphingomonas sp. TaxID=28214 RepID=UPI0035C87466
MTIASVADPVQRRTALVRLREVRVLPVVLAALAILAVSALAAQVLLRVIGVAPAVSRPVRSVSVPAPARARPPAAAPIYASPAAGTTGTIALPPVPLAFDRIMPGDGSVVAAQPFSTALASAADRGRALECLTAAIYYEAASEPDDGQRAVAQVILNRARHPAFPATVCGVVYQGSERSVCQFSFACDGALARVPSRGGWARAARVAAAALGGYVFAPVGLATHYHTYAVTPAWNRTLVMTDAIGAHFFHRWKGYWGTAGAFVQRYRGGEPVPGPHRPADPLLTPVLPVPVIADSQTIVSTPLVGAANAAVPVATATPRAITPDTQLQPRHAQSGEARTPAPSPTAPPPVPESQILDRWKDSGKPLR